MGFSIDDAIWDHSTVAKNRERLDGLKVARKLMLRVVRDARRIIHLQHPRPRRESRNHYGKMTARRPGPHHPVWGERITEQRRGALFGGVGVPAIEHGGSPSHPLW